MEREIDRHGIDQHGDGRVRNASLPVRLWRRLSANGVDTNLSSFDAKLVVGVNQSAVLALLTDLALMVYPPSWEFPLVELVDVVCNLAWLLTLALNAARRHSLARVVLIAGSVATNFAFGLLMPREADLSLLLLITAMGTWVVFPRREWRRAAALGLASVLLPFALEWQYAHGGAYYRPPPALVGQLSLLVRFVLGALLLAFGAMTFLNTARAEEQVETERRKSRALLLNVLPKVIADRLLARTGVIADRFDEATVLFADIVNFTRLSERVPAPQLVTMLDQIFSAFDLLAEKHGLEKIKTVGDAYMVAGGIPGRRTDHVEAVARMALEMPGVLAALAGEAAGLSLRIGLDTGPVVAGVIGRKKFTYDLWGDTVNTASRMESHGQPGRIHCTRAVHERLSGAFDFEARGLIDVKGKGELSTFFLTGERRRN